jgi:hypothetical protein
MAPGERRSQRERQFAKYGARYAPTQGAFDAVDQFDDLDFAGDDSVQRTFSTFVQGEFAGPQGARRRRSARGAQGRAMRGSKIAESRAHHQQSA